MTFLTFNLPFAGIFESDLFEVITFWLVLICFLSYIIEEGYFHNGVSQQYMKCSRRNSSNRGNV